MSVCEYLESCPFFKDKIDNMPATSETLKKKFCLGDKSKCARYIIAKELENQKVPVDLFPNQIYKAKEIIEKEIKLKTKNKKFRK